MHSRLIGQVERVSGPIVHVKNISDAKMMELVFVGEEKLIGEIVKLKTGKAVVQVYENTTGLKPGENIYGSNKELSVELAPGLIGSIFDGIQRPLITLEAQSGHFMGKGIKTVALDRDRKWHFVPNPLFNTGEIISAGQTLGTVKETDSVIHHIMNDPKQAGMLTFLASEGDYNITDIIAKITNEKGISEDISMLQFWSVRKPRPVKHRKPLNVPLITGQRIIDTLFPLAKGGTVAVPGPFGAGKTVIQHSIAKWCDADIIVYIGCGERGNEMTDVLREFPHLIDPRTGKKLMDRTILIANTSNMPVSSREASVYTGVTIAEYYRDMGYHVALMADSTSRWAEAMRELSARMEEMPAEEGFPAYLPSRIASFYERAGFMDTLNGKEGSISIIGAVSPPGGDFSEPITQHTKRFVRAFWSLDRALAYARHFPSVSWIDSYSEYQLDLTEWWTNTIGKEFIENKEIIVNLLRKEEHLSQIAKLVGTDALPENSRFILEVCTLFKNAFLQQSAYDKIDAFSSLEKQSKMLNIIVFYYKRGLDAIAKGVPLNRLNRISTLQDIIKMKMTITEDNLTLINELYAMLGEDIDRLELRHG